MKGLLPGLSNFCARHHRVVPVEHLALVGGVAARRPARRPAPASARLRAGALDPRVARAEPVAGAAGDDGDGDDGGERRELRAALRCANVVFMISPWRERRNGARPRPWRRPVPAAMSASRASSSARRASSTAASVPVPPRYAASAASRRCAASGSISSRMRCACARADSHSASIASTSAARIRRVSSRIARAASSSFSFAACSRSCRVPGDHGRSIETISDTMFE